MLVPDIGSRKRKWIKIPWYLFFKAMLWFKLIVKQEYYSVSRLPEDTLRIIIVSHLTYGAKTMWDHFQSNNERVESFKRGLSEDR